MKPSNVAEDVKALADAMRAVGAGRATFGTLTLDLTAPPFKEPEKPAPVAPVSAEEEAARRESVAFAAGRGKRVVLPFGAKR